MLKEERRATVVSKCFRRCSGVLEAFVARTLNGNNKRWPQELLFPCNSNSGGSYSTFHGRWLLLSDSWTYGGRDKSD
ncbi:hypothetical protein I3843_04G150900 [Carya illinoinensis]|nr:hypothetical protein I3843_04G150900 [Carya illinoinensis]